MAVKTKFAIVKTVLDRPIRIATFGDSTSTLDNAGTCNRDGIAIPFPSGSVTSKIPFSVATLLNRAHCVYVGDGGIFGNTTQQMFNRSTSNVSATRKAVHDVLLTKPDIIVFHGGSINDLIPLTGTATEAFLDSVCARHAALVQEFANHGLHVIDSGVYGYSSTSATEPIRAIIRDAVVRLNPKIKSAIASIPKAHFIDVVNTLSDSTGAFIANMSSDGVHLSSYGANALGALESVILGAIFEGKASGTIGYDFQKDYANAYNGQPLKHSTSVSNVTVNSKTTTLFDYTIDFTVTSATNSIIVNIGNISDIFAQFLSGDKVDITLRLGLFDENGDSYEHPIGSRMRFCDGANNIYYDIENFIVNGIGNVTERLYMPANGSALNASSLLNITVANLPVGNYKLKLLPFILQKVSV